MLISANRIALLCFMRLLGDKNESCRISLINHPYNLPIPHNHPLNLSQPLPPSLSPEKKDSVKQPLVCGLT